MSKILGCVIPLLICGLLIYLLIAYAPGALFYLGAGIYLCVALYYYYGAHRQSGLLTAARGEAERLAISASLERKRQTVWGRAEIILHSVAQHLQLVSISITWLFAVPLSILIFMLFWKQAEIGNRVGMLKAASFPSEVVAAISGVFATCVVLVLLHLGASQRTIVFFSALIALCIFIRLISFTIGPISLPKALRLKSRLPYLVFIVLALLDGVALVFNLHVLRATTTEGVGSLSIEAFSQTAAAVFNTPSFIRMILPPRPIDLFSLILGISGIVFFAAVLNNLLRIKQFRKTDEDYVLLAAIENQIGAFSKALRYLQKVQDTREARVFVARATALGGLQQFPQALAETKAFIELDKSARLGELPGLPMFTLVGLIVHSGADDTTKARTVMFAEKSGISSRDLAFLLELVLSTSGGDSTAIASELLAAGILASHPPAQAIALFCSGQREKAAEALSAAAYNHPVDELYRKQCLLLVQLADPDTTRQQDAENFARWLTENIGEIEATVQSSNELSEAFPLVGILRTLVSLAVLHSHPDLERIRYLRDLQHGKLRAMLPADSEIASFLGVIEKEDA